MSYTNRSLLPGIILIVIGALLLLNQTSVISVSWYELYPVLFIIIGGALIISGIYHKKHGAVFWGTNLFLLGVFFFLRNYDIIPYLFMDELWPVFLIIFGISFLALFIVNPADWGVLVPAGFLLFFGLIFLARNLHMESLKDWLFDYWPMILIVVGAYIIWDSFRKTKPSEEVKE